MGALLQASIDAHVTPLVRRSTERIGHLLRITFIATQQTSLERPGEREGTAMPFVLCADLSIFPDNTVLGPAFTFAAMDFWDAPGGTITSFVNETAGERALQFPDTGLEINLPLSVPWVRMRIGQFATDYRIEAFDPGGAVVAAFNMTFPNSYRNLYLRGPDITVLRFTGGDNEGSVESVCIPIP